MLDSGAVHAIEPATRTPDPQPERLAGLAVLPVLTTGLYYALPPRLQHQPAILFLPQVLAYVGLAVWATQNSRIPERLGLKLYQLRQGLRWGIVTGLILGLVNVSVILRVVPLLGRNIEFLRETPHAQVPVALMLPWTILLIAIAVELNFRGFLLGRWLALCKTSWLGHRTWVGPGLACAYPFEHCLRRRAYRLRPSARQDRRRHGCVGLRADRSGRPGDELVLRGRIG